MKIGEIWLKTSSGGPCQALRRLCVQCEAKGGSQRWVRSSFLTAANFTLARTMGDTAGRTLFAKTTELRGLRHSLWSQIGCIQIPATYKLNFLTYKWVK